MAPFKKLIAALVLSGLFYNCSTPVKELQNQLTKNEIDEG